MMPQRSRQAKFQEIGGGAWSFYVLGAGETPAPQSEAMTASICGAGFQPAESRTFVLLNATIRRHKLQFLDLLVLRD